MTYEPGQQVLVRGAVVETDSDDDGKEWLRIKVPGVYFFISLPAADVVGPAPAPTEVVKVRDVDAVTFIDRLRRKLAAAEAERDAYAAALNRVTHEYEPQTFGAWKDNEPDTYGDTVELCGQCRKKKDMDRHQTPAVIRRALSVEATGTEGGGGHE